MATLCADFIQYYKDNLFLANINRNYYFCASKYILSKRYNRIRNNTNNNKYDKNCSTI